MPATREINGSSCSVEIEDEWKKEERENMSDWGSPHLSNMENEERASEQLQGDPIEDYGAYFNYAHFGEADSKVATLQTRSGSIKNTKSLKDLGRQERRRIISKSGDCNTQLYRVSHKNRRLMQDVFTTMVDMQWRYVFLAFVGSFILSWFGFGVIWWFMSYVHGDYLLENINNSTFVPCILANKNFASAFLFSQETQHTIGYGSRQTTEECPEAIILQCVQSIVGVLIQACMAGVVFAKLARAKCRTNTVVFSKSAVITMRNGGLFLVFRVGNMRSSHLLEAHLRAQMVQKVTTDEGEIIHFHQEEMKVGTQLSGEDDRALLLWPILVAHPIDEESPLWRMSPQDIQKSNFEIIVVLEGIIEPTGNTTQARTSYLPQEILWGHRFDNLVSYARKQGVYAIDCSSIDQTMSDNTPRVPACRLQQLNSQRKASFVPSPKAGLHSRKTSQVSGNHLPPPANMFWAQNRQENGHLHQHQHGEEDEVVELKTE